MILRWKLSKLGLDTEKLLEEKVISKETLAEAERKD